jgi:hypothetical protein
MKVKANCTIERRSEKSQKAGRRAAGRREASRESGVSS